MFFFFLFFSLLIYSPQLIGVTWHGVTTHTHTMHLPSSHTPHSCAHVMHTPPPPLSHIFRPKWCLDTSFGPNVCFFFCLFILINFSFVFFNKPPPTHCIHPHPPYLIFTGPNDTSRHCLGLMYVFFIILIDIHWSFFNQPSSTHTASTSTQYSTFMGPNNASRHCLGLMYVFFSSYFN